MARGDSTVRFSVSLPKALLRHLDTGVVARGHASRSEYVRDLLREKQVEEAWKENQREVVGVLTVCFEHHHRLVQERMMELQHRRFVNILCNTHVHLDHDDCLEAIFVRGRPDEVEKLCLEIGGLRGVKFAKLTKIAKLTH